MRKYIKIFTAFVSLALLIGVHTVSVAQPPPPPPGGGHGGGGNQPPGSGAPLGEGVFLLVGLAGLYGGKKAYDMKKDSDSDNK